MNKGKFLKDVSLNILITLILNIFLFFINKYFLINLGIKNLGLMKLFTQMLMYLNIVESGVGIAATYALYKPIEEEDFIKISIILNTLSKLYKKISIIILIVGLSFNFFLSFLIGNDLEKNVYLYWSLYVVNLSISYCYIKYNIFFIASQEYNLTRIIEVTGKSICYILQLMAIIILKKFYVYIILMYIDILIQYILYKYFFKKKYSYLKKINEIDVSIQRNMKKLLLHKLGGIFVFNIDLILITKFISLDMVGLYASYQMVTQIIVVGINMILSVIRPRIGKYIVVNSKSSIYNFWKKYNIMYLFLCLFLYFCTNCLIDSFIKLWLGNIELLEKNIKILILFNMFILCFRKFIELFKEASGFFNDIEAPILEAILKLVFSLVLVKVLGLQGILIGTAISNIVIIMIYKPIFIFKNCFHKSVREYMKVYGHYLLLILISLFLIRMINIENYNSWSNWLISLSFVSLKIGIILFIVFLLNKDFRNVIKVYVLKKK